MNNIKKMILIVENYQHKKGIITEKYNLSESYYSQRKSSEYFSYFLGKT